MFPVNALVDGRQPVHVHKVDDERTYSFVRGRWEPAVPNQYMVFCFGDPMCHHIVRADRIEILPPTTLPRRTRHHRRCSMPKPGIMTVAAYSLIEGDIVGSGEVVCSVLPPVKNLRETGRTVALKLYNPKRHTFRWATWNKHTRIGILQRIPGAELRWDIAPLVGHAPVVEIHQCGHCGRRWNDAAISSITPAPAGRCPFEYEHVYDDTDYRLEV